MKSRQIRLWGSVLIVAITLIAIAVRRAQGEHDSELGGSVTNTTDPDEWRSDWASSAPARAMPKANLPRSIAAIGPTPERSVPTTEQGALALLQSESQSAWDLRRDDFTPRIRTLIHGQWSGALGGSARTNADAFVKTYSQALFGVESANVQFQREEITDRTRIVYQESVGGVPVYGATLNLFFENGVLSRVQNDLVSGSPQTSAPAISLSQAFGLYQSTLNSKSNVSMSIGGQAPQTVLYPGPGGTLVYAYEFTTDESSKTNPQANSNSFRVIYDAEDPHVIKRWSTHVQ